MVSTAIATEVTGAVKGRLIGALAAAFGLGPATLNVEDVDVEFEGAEHRDAETVIVDRLLTRC